MVRVIVVGAGVVGLTCAARLLEDGHDVDVVARDLPLETTSSVAAAIWYPHRVLPEDRVVAWSRTSYGVFETLAGEDGTGVRMLAGQQLFGTRTADPWWREAAPSLTRLTEVPAPYADGVGFIAPVVEMPVYLRWLAQRVETLGGTVTRMALSALPDTAAVVVNATGLGARRMAEDPTTTPVRGQVVHVEQVGLREWSRATSDGARVYVVPRSHDIVVGGTDDAGSWDRRPDPEVAERILDRAVELVPELAGARVLGHRVGLRPVRPRVRLEREQRDRTTVVHCYGHGGGGVTTSWGCAEEVADLVGGLPQNSRRDGSSIPRSAS